MSKTRSNRGPSPQTVKIEGDWEQAIDKALGKKRPKDGWPKPGKANSPKKRK